MAPPVAAASSGTSAMVKRAQSALTVAASLAASAVVVRTFINDFVPHQVQTYVREAIGSTLSKLLFSASPWAAYSDLTLVIDQYECGRSNLLYEAAASYLDGKMSPTTRRLRCAHQRGDRDIVVTLDKDEEVSDVYGGIEFTWRLKAISADGDSEDPRMFFELTFRRAYKEMAVGEYLPHLLQLWKATTEAEKPIRFHMLRANGSRWTSVPLDHPATFDTVAMEPDAKRAIVEDLNRFVRRREYYRKVGKAWKRGYLLYGPPGTGKSSLIAAMANFLKFDVYDLELTEFSDNSSLRSMIVGTANRSILVVEDADCSIQLRSRSKVSKKNKDNRDDSSTAYTSNVTLSGVLNTIDGLLSSCGDERIIVLTTNHRDRLDPALLRPGRMDLHIHMSYCTPAGFRVLADNYHEVKEHKLFPEIERLIQEEVNITPAEITGELMKSEHADEAFQCLIDFIVQKKDDPNRRKGAGVVGMTGGMSPAPTQPEQVVDREDGTKKGDETITEYNKIDINRDGIQREAESGYESEANENASSESSYDYAV